MAGTVTSSPAQTLPPHAPGTELSPGYRVVTHMARGRRLDVYDAWSYERRSRCVLKTLRPERGAEGPARRALIREGRLLSRFTHPHLVRAYEITGASDDGRPVVVLETLDGETLEHLVHRLSASGRRLPLAEVVVMGSQLTSVLAYLHHQGWLHLDLKPANIVASGGRAKLLDLSIARRPGRAHAGTGTVDYLSPEQARGGILTTAADVWGLGAVLYTALAGEPPYGRVSDAAGSWSDGDDGVGRDSSVTGDDASDLFTDATTRGADGADYPQLVGDPVPVGRRRRLPAALGTAVDACLAREPNDRPTLAEVAAALDAWLAARLRHGVRH
jgi:serine/threonine protein kinase